MKSNRKMMLLPMLVLTFAMMFGMTAFAAEEAAYVPELHATIWALLPPVIAIGLALITKEVYSSLFIGILAGGILYSGFNFEMTMNHVFENGIISVLSDAGNVGILIFLVILGVIVCLMNKAGGSAAFGQFAASKIKSRIGAQLATVMLGVMIFIDDYFNCLTVGSVMRPVTDKFKVSRAKLSYLIDATAAPICIIAPISSWAAAVTSYVDRDDGFELFLRSIPYNFYALLTILMMVGLTVLRVEFGTMKKHEENAMKGDLFTTAGRPYEAEDVEVMNTKGTVLDLIAPIASLIVCCVVGMLYTGGFFDGVDFITAFADCDASLGLAYGSFFGLLITIAFYLVRRVLTFKECMDCIPEGFKSMVSAILILTFAWTLQAMTSSLGADVYVAALVQTSAGNLVNFLPAIIFVVGLFLAFATGTSWGTFGILIPIVVAVFESTNPEMMVISISACMAGAVCGDHCSPISDTTIMASAGAQCEHVNHVMTQLPYALVVAAISFVTYIVAGFVQSAWIALPVGMALTIGVLMALKMTGNVVTEK